MPSIKDTDLARSDNDMQLLNALKHWRPDRPRRWLIKYGGLSADSRSQIAERFRTVRMEAQKRLVRPGVKSVNGLSSHILHLE